MRVSFTQSKGIKRINMKNETTGGSKNPKPTILGANLLQVGGDDASSLVGGIVEKGFSDTPQPRPCPTSAPRPTVLPFPVARHRSHGPVCVLSFLFFRVTVSVLGLSVFIFMLYLPTFGS